MTPDIVALQSRLDAALQQATGTMEGASSVLVRQHLSEPGARAVETMAPALFCLGLATALGNSETTIAPAISLALLTEMARVFGDLDSGQGLRAAWGMPRALNAGDAFYVLAQEQLLRGCEGLPPEDGLKALGLLDTASREFSEALQASAADSNGLRVASRTLYPFAARLAALMLRLDAGDVDAVERLSYGLDSEQVSLEGALALASAIRSDA